VKIAIFGAGAIGGYLGAKLALAGLDVTLIARGAHLVAMEKDGLRLIEGEGGQVVRPRCLADAATAEAGPQDYVFLTLKAHSMTGALPAIAPLLGPDTAVVTAQNGVPWWYFYQLPGPLQGHRLASVDPGGHIWRTIGPERAIGCVVYPACEVVGPGVVRHVRGDRFSLGEPGGDRSRRLERLARALVAAGLRAPQRSRIRGEIWLKILGNVALNPLSVLTRATLAEIEAQPETKAFARAVMKEAAAVAAALGEHPAVGLDARLAGAAEVGDHKTSMLQDLEAGRPLEIDALTGAVRELAQLTGVATPNLNALDGMVRLLAAAAQGGVS
jgi:2-dehydropantoate 2-reductase